MKETIVKYKDAYYKLHVELKIPDAKELIPMKLNKQTNNHN